VCVCVCVCGVCSESSSMLKQQLPNLLWQEEDQEVDGDNAEEEGEEADDDEAMGQSTVSPEPTCEAPTFTQECTRLSLSLCVLSLLCVLTHKSASRSLWLSYNALLLSYHHSALNSSSQSWEPCGTRM
jgi:hypothetical protein